MNLNKILIAGRLTADPELKHTPKGTAVCGFAIALNRKWKTEGGEQKEEVTYVDCTAWNAGAEAIAKYFSKGREIFVEGRWQNESWEDKATGQKRMRAKVLVERFEFVGANPNPTAKTESPARPAVEAPAEGGHGVGAKEGEIPF